LKNKSIFASKNKVLKKAFLAVILILGMFFSCNKQPAPKPVQSHPTDTVKKPVDTVKKPVDTIKNPIDTVKHVFAGPNVYLSGFLNYPYSTVAAYWRNDTLVTLTNSNIYSAATAITAAGRDVYVAGHAVIDGKDLAVYWKNGVLNKLGYGEANAIELIGNDVYVAGFVATGDPGNSPVVACYWKNGVVVTLPNPVAETSGGVPGSSANAIAAQNNDVFVTGSANVSYGGGNPVAIYWKNGKATALTSYSVNFGALNATSHGNSIVAKGTDVYIAGDITPPSGILSSPGDIGGAVYWKNGTVVALSNGTSSVAGGIIVQNGDVYASGSYYANTAFYWKNKVRYILPSSLSNAQTTGMIWFNNDIYISGNVFNGSNIQGKGAYWKNGKLVTLHSPLPAQTTGIAVAAFK
jgi:hypothetical protein